MKEHFVSSLAEHTVVITGAGSGLGLGVARYFHARGARLGLLEVSDFRADRLRDEFGSDSVVHAGDVRSVDDLTSLRDATTQAFGTCDSVIGVQGIFDGNLPLSEIPTQRVQAVFEEVYNINVLGYILTARVFLDVLKLSGGSLILTSSTAAYAADGGGAIYTSSKSAVTGLVRQLAYEFAPEVRVNGVAPCGIFGSQLRGPATLGLENTTQADIPEDVLREQFRSVLPLRRLPDADDYGPVFAMLASKTNRTMTGQTIIADQGLLNRSVIAGGE